MRIMAAAALLLLLVSLSAAAATATAKSNTTDSRETPYGERSEEEMRRIFTELKAEHDNAYNSLSVPEEKRGYDMFKRRLRLIDRRSHDDGYSAWSWDRDRSDVETRRIFLEWKASCGKIYSSIDHEEQWYTVFQDNLRGADRHNAGYAIGVHPSAQGINHFTDLTSEKISATCCGFFLESPPPAELERMREIQDRLRLVYAPSSEIY